MNHKHHYQTLGKYYHEISSSFDRRLIKKIKIFFKTFSIIKKREILKTKKLFYKDLEKPSSYHDDNWIKEINDQYLPIAEKNLKEFYRKESKRPCRILGQKKYSKSSKGKIARKRVYALRNVRIKDFEVPENEKEMIRNFYSECPDGFVVDHIIPISKGGKHRLDNMQWIDFSLNARKAAKIIIPLSEYPHCRLDIKLLFSY